MKRCNVRAALTCLVILAFSGVPVSDARDAAVFSPVLRNAAVSATQAPLAGPGPLRPTALHLDLPESARRAEGLEVVELCVQANMARQDIPGVAVAIMQDGELVYERGFGVKHRDIGGEVVGDTIFRVGSITKQFTAAAVMQQVEQGALDLGARVTDWVPELALSGYLSADAIRVEHLLTHSSGYPDNVVSISGPVGETALADWVLTQRSVRLHAAPGSFYNYANPNYMLAALVAERASGMPYREYTQARIWDAAGMTRTTYEPSVVMGDGNFSHGHFEHPVTGAEQIYAPDDYDSGSFGPAGYAFSTAGDLVRWADLLMGGGAGVLSPSSATRMQGREIWTHALPSSHYGFGIFNERYEGLGIRQHGGNVPGWGSYLLWVPERDFAVAVLGNTFDSPIDTAYCIVDQLLDPPGAESEDVDPDPSRWHRFEGSYPGFDLLGEPFDAEVYLEDDALMVDLYSPVDPSDRTSGRLLPVMHDYFVVDFDGDGALDLDLTFITRGGEPWRANWLRHRLWVGERAVGPRSADRP